MRSFTHQLHSERTPPHQGGARHGRRNAISLFAVIAMIVAMLAIAPSAAAATTIYVDGGGVCAGNVPCHTTVQAGINAAITGDTVFVYPGTYVEDLTIAKQITLQGEDRDTTIIDGGGTGLASGEVVYVTADFVTIAGVTIQNGYDGIYAPGSSVDNLTLRDLVVQDNGSRGINMPHSAGSHLFEDCVIRGNADRGFYGHQFRNSVIRDCEVYENGSHGIAAGWGSYSEFYDNVVYDNGGSGFDLDAMSYGRFHDNLVYDNAHSGINVRFVAHDNRVYDNVVIGNGVGIRVNNSSSSNRNNVVYHNDIVDNTVQASGNGRNIWDDGYPSGGNYWSDYTGFDLFNGPSQDVPGSDGIGDTPYILASPARPDRYPLMTPRNLLLPPVADANGPYTGDEGSPITLDGSGSVSVDGTIVLYEWDLDDDGVYDDATGVFVAHTYGDNGVYPIGLRVTDEYGLSDTDSGSVSVSNVAPTVDTPAAVPEPSDEGAAVGVTAMFTDPGFDDSPFTCTVDYGDGSPLQVGLVAGDTCTGPTHVYADDGTFTVEVMVTDKDGGSGNAVTSHEVMNVPPDVVVDIASQAVQYSDYIVDVTVTAMDVPADVLTISTTWSVVGGAAIVGLPGNLTLTDSGCSVNSHQGCEWVMVGQITEPAGTYTVEMTVEDGDGGATTVETDIVVTAEDATIVFDGTNQVAVEVATPGGDSGSFTLTVEVTETQPDLPVGTAAFREIGLADLTMTLAPVGPGSPRFGVCVAGAVTGVGYDAVLPVTCTFDGVPVNTYTVEATAAGGYYDGFNEDVLVVYDPSLGFTTGGGWFYWPDTDDKTNFGYTMKYNKKGTAVKGNFLLIRHLDDGSKYRVKSNALYGLAIGEADGFGWASFSGKATYLEPGWADPIGNHEFVVYVEDHGQPGDGDRVWLEMHDKARDVIDSLSMDRDAPQNAVTIRGGNIVVPH